MRKKITYKQNQKINGLIFVREVEPYVSPSGRKHRKALFRCYCGNEFEAIIAHVKNGNTKSCGCWNNQKREERFTFHGLSKHPLYKVFYGIRLRCYNPKAINYKNYGKRGIKICDEWKNDFKTFYDFCIQNGWKKGLQIDRINNDENYEPGNCRFVTQIENLKKNNKLNFELAQEIRDKKLLNPKITSKELGVLFRVSPSTIYNVLSDKTWNK
jgi:hypothetical protein